MVTGLITETPGATSLSFMCPLSSGKRCAVNPMKFLALCYRPYAIPQVTKRETDSGQKSGYYAAILSGKEDHGL